MQNSKTKNKPKTNNKIASQIDGKIPVTRETTPVSSRTRAVSSGYSSLKRPNANVALQAANVKATAIPEYPVNLKDDYLTTKKTIYPHSHVRSNSSSLLTSHSQVQLDKPNDTTTRTKSSRKKIDTNVINESTKIVNRERYMENLPIQNNTHYSKKIEFLENENLSLKQKLDKLSKIQTTVESHNNIILRAKILELQNELELTRSRQYLEFDKPESDRCIKWASRSRSKEPKSLEKKENNELLTNQLQQANSECQKLQRTIKAYENELANLRGQKGHSESSSDDLVGNLQIKIAELRSQLELNDISKKSQQTQQIETKSVINSLEHKLAEAQANYEKSLKEFRKILELKNREIHELKEFTGKFQSENLDLKSQSQVSQMKEQKQKEFEHDLDLQARKLRQLNSSLQKEIDELKYENQRLRLVIGKDADKITELDNEKIKMEKALAKVQEHVSYLSEKIIHTTAQATSRIRESEEKTNILLEENEILNREKNEYRSKFEELLKDYKLKARNLKALKEQHQSEHGHKETTKEADEKINTLRYTLTQSQEEIKSLKKSLAQSRHETAELRNQIATSNGQLKSVEVSSIVNMFNKGIQTAKKILRDSKYSTFLNIHDLIMRSVDLGYTLTSDRLNLVLTTTCGTNPDRDSFQIQKRMRTFALSVMQANARAISTEILNSLHSLPPNHVSNNAVTEVFRLVLDQATATLHGNFDAALVDDVITRFVEVGVYVCLADPPMRVGGAGGVSEFLNYRDYFPGKTFLAKLPDRVREVVKQQRVDVFPGLFVQGEEGET
ncbi:hypothetical protein HK096_005454, partial [Nowakowskiella sp. JEL0078]